MDKKHLYIVATPIGNLADISARALDSLKSVEAVLCEDTRQTQKLMAHFEIHTKKISLHQHSSTEKIKTILNQFADLAYVSDAGTPGISDPGNKIVQVALELGFLISPIPGPCAAIALLSVSGLPTDKFNFLGFLPHKGRTKVYEEIKDADRTVCFYESPHRIARTLTDLQKILGNRQVVVGRELTKIFETIYRGTAGEVLEQVKDNIKGEFVIAISVN